MSSYEFFQMALVIGARYGFHSLVQYAAGRAFVGMYVAVCLEAGMMGVHALWMRKLTDVAL